MSKVTPVHNNPNLLYDLSWVWVLLKELTPKRSPKYEFSSSLLNDVLRYAKYIAVKWSQTMVMGITLFLDILKKLFLFLPRSLYFAVFVMLSLSPSPSISLFFCLPQSLSVSHSLSTCHCLSLSSYVSRSLSLSLSLSLCHRLILCLFLNCYRQAHQFSLLITLLSKLAVA